MEEQETFDISTEVELCGENGCRLPKGHRGAHNKYPTSAWGFLDATDKKKIIKAGFATPRGGEKGAYQNHVDRSNKVIIPYERLDAVNLDDFEGGYVVRLFPEQCFSASKELIGGLSTNGTPIIIGENAFVLYGSHSSYRQFPPLDSWSLRYLEKDGERVTNRGVGVMDRGHYVLRIPKLGAAAKRFEGPPQGIFAPEHSSKEMNYLSRCVLAWLIVHTQGSPYTTTMARHLKAILTDAGILPNTSWERNGVMRGGLTTCPLCMRPIKHYELRENLSLENEDGLSNASVLVEGAIRSTIVNLFHLEPLSYNRLDHKPEYVSWGHATCNTKLGQRRCYSLEELQEQDLKLAILTEDGPETFGWISEGWEFIRSPHGAVWVRISKDGTRDPDTGVIS